MSKTLDAAEAFARDLRIAGLPAPERELRIAALATGGTGSGVRARRAAAGLNDWRFDIAWPHAKVAIEVDGGGWAGGRHSRGQGIESDCAKLSTAVALGWRVLRVTPKQCRDGRALAWAEAVLAGVPEAAPARFALDRCS